LRLFLTAFPDTVNRLNIGLFIYCQSVYFYPGVSLEGQFLCSQNHLRRYAMFSKKVNSHETTLEAESPFWIPGARVIDRSANPVDGVLDNGLVGNFPALYSRVKSPEGAERVKDIID